MLSKRLLLPLKVGILLLGSLILTTVVVRYSSEHGKLAIPPDYDDSHSLIEGALRYLIWKNEGWRAAWHYYLQDPPHSFLHYYLTSALFAVFGIHQSVVYWFSGVFVFIAALGVMLLLREIQLLPYMALLTGFLCLPALFNMIFDFRSECAMAALLFMACCLAVRSAWANRHDMPLALFSGICFALCLGIKPAMFLYVLGMLFCSGVVWIAAALSRHDGSLMRAIQNWVMASVIAILPFSFHYYLNANQIFGYIYTNAFASDFWKQKGTLFDQLLFHLFGFAGRFQLGVFTQPLLGLLLLGFTLGLVFRKKLNPSLLRYFCSMIFLTVMAYAGVAINSINQNYFGMTFDLLLAASAVLVLAMISLAMARPWGDLLCCVVAISALLAWRVPMTQDYVERTRVVGGDAALNWRRKGPAQVFSLVKKSWVGKTTPKIWFGAYGWVDGNTITWEAVKVGVPWKIWNYYARQPAIGALYPQWPDVLIIPDPGVIGTIDLPLNKSIDAMASAVSRDPAFHRVGQILDPNGKRICVYLKNEGTSESKRLE
jgi:hypothetical protein